MTHPVDEMAKSMKIMMEGKRAQEELCSNLDPSYGSCENKVIMASGIIIGATVGSIPSVGIGAPVGAFVGGLIALAIISIKDHGKEQERCECTC